MNQLHVRKSFLLIIFPVTAFLLIAIPIVLVLSLTIRDGIDAAQHPFLYQASRPQCDTVTPNSCFVRLTIHNPSNQSRRPNFQQTDGPGVVDWDGKPQLFVYDSKGHSCRGWDHDSLHEVPADSSVTGNVTCNENEIVADAAYLTIYGERVPVRKD